MTLTDINHEDILLHFLTIDNFNLALDNAIEEISSQEDQLLLQAIKYYFNLVFHKKVNMVRDIENLNNVMIDTLERLEIISKNNKSIVLNFLYTRISQNHLYVLNISKRA